MIENDKINNLYLFYSEKKNNQNSTKDISIRVCKLLEKLNTKLSVKYIPIENIYNPGASLDLVDVAISPCHLDITGGSKVMSFVINRELQNYCSYLLISYLNPVNQDLNFSDNTTFSLKNYNISLEDMLHLHNLSLKKSPIVPTLKIKDVVNKILNLYEKPKFIEYLKIIRQYKSRIDEIKTCNKQKFLEFIQENQEIIKLMEDIYPDVIFNFTKESSINEIKSVKRNFKMIDGGWFEIYIYELIEEIMKESHFEQYELYTSVEFINNNDISSKNKKEFEIDIILILNHKLYGFSLTTSNRIERNKNKVFEIIYRIRQIGGDEANSLFITTNDFKNIDSFNKFKQDLENDFNFDRKVLIDYFPEPLKNRTTYKLRLKDYILGD